MKTLPARCPFVLAVLAGSLMAPLPLVGSEPSESKEADTVEILLAEAGHFLLEERLDEAVRRVKKAVRRSRGTSAPAFRLLADLKILTQEPEDALEAGLAALGLEPELASGDPLWITLHEAMRDVRWIARYKPTAKQRSLADRLARSLEDRLQGSEGSAAAVELPVLLAQVYIWQSGLPSTSPEEAKDLNKESLSLLRKSEVPPENELFFGLGRFLLCGAVDCEPAPLFTGRTVDPDARAEGGAAEAAAEEELVPPSKLQSAPPQYTTEARRSRIQGRVILHATVEKDGTVSDAAVVEGLPLGLSEAAIESLRQWKFAPATLDGEPVCASYFLTINFSLR